MCLPFMCGSVHVRCINVPFRSLSVPFRCVVVPFRCVGVPDFPRYLQCQVLFGYIYLSVPPTPHSSVPSLHQAPFPRRVLHQAPFPRRVLHQAPFLCAISIPGSITQESSTPGPIALSHLYTRSHYPGEFYTRPHSSVPSLHQVPLPRRVLHQAPFL